MRNRNFESISLQRGVRCELNLGEAALPMTSRRVLLIGTGFQEVRVERQWREGSIDSFDEYWGILPSQGAVALFVARAQAADPHFLPDRRTEGRDCGCSDRTADSRSGSSRMTQGVVDLARYWNFESVSLQRRVYKLSVPSGHHPPATGTVAERKR